MSEDHSMSALSEPTQTVAFAGKDIQITPMELGELIEFSAAITPLLPALDRLNSIQHALSAEDDSALAQGIVEMLAAHGKHLFAALAVAIRQDESTIRKAKDLSGLVNLVLAVIRVNSDFFVQQAAPLLHGLRAQPSAANGDGTTPSTSLSEAATPAAT